MANTKISWTSTTNPDGTISIGKVWNPTVGCTKVSDGCRNCYAERMAARLQSMGKPEYQSVVDINGKWTGKVVCVESRLQEPLHWRKPCKIFVDSMSDLFHDEVPDKFILDVFTTMFDSRFNTFIVLTKRPKRMKEFITGYGFDMSLYPRIWLGVSAENQKAADERIPLLLQTPAAVRFVSAEPLLGEIDLHLHSPAGERPLATSDCLSWVIAGGESGPYSRIMKLDWAMSLRDQCKEAGVAYYFKQTGGLHHGSDLLDGVEYKEFPQ